MTEVEQVRHLLDERGIAYDESGDDHRAAFLLNYCDNCGDYLNKITVIGEHIIADHAYCTPEQAVDVIVGYGTCHTVLMDCFGNPPYNKSGLNGNDVACGCSECGVPWSTMGVFRGNKLKHNFKACPLCGRKVVG